MKLKSTKELQQSKSRKNWTVRITREGKHKVVESRKLSPQRRPLYSLQERVRFIPRPQSCGLAVIELSDGQKKNEMSRSLQARSVTLVFFCHNHIYGFCVISHKNRIIITI